MTRWISTLAVFALVAGAFLLGHWPPEAQALDQPLGTLQGGDVSYSCGTTPTKIAPQTATMSARAMVLYNDSATAVYVGGPDVDSTDGVSVCNSGCEETLKFAYDGRQIYCRIADPGDGATPVSVKVLWSY